MPPKKVRWKGVFSVHGEVTEIWRHAVSKARARYEMKLELNEKYGRKVYPSDEKITQE